MYMCVCIYILVACADKFVENRQYRILRSSFWIKLAFILVELVLAIVFVSTTFTHNNNVAAVFEWVIAFIFTFYVASFIIDLKPAIYTKSHAARFEKTHQMEDGLDVNGRNGLTGNGFVADRTAAHF